MKIYRHQVPNNQNESAKTIAELWIDEAEKRLKAYRNGELKATSYEEVFDG